MSHITSLRFVNASASTSFYATAINFSLLTLMVVFLVSASLPLLVSSSLIALSLIIFHRYRFLPEPMVGAIVISDEGVLDYQGSQCLVKFSSFNTAYIGVILTLTDNRRLILWRDSVTDDEYRKLLVQLRSIDTTPDEKM
ncbi:protein YgfX [Vibrio amylolyticus]|uniref:protein YgfX n=1 Tax=Vibrio amylolyticus TaxID=2847292 RepID=UPI003551BD81